MSGPIKTMGLGGVPLYGTRRATFIIDDMPSKATDIAVSLKDELGKSYHNTGWHMYEYFHRHFSRADSNEGIHDGISLWTNMFLGKDISLLAEFLDTREVSIEGVRASYIAQTFQSHGCVATLKRDSEDGILTVNPWEKGIPFDPTFLYQTGEKFGKLVKSQ